MKGTALAVQWVDTFFRDIIRHAQHLEQHHDVRRVGMGLHRKGTRKRFDFQRWFGAVAGPAEVIDVADHSGDFLRFKSRGRRGCPCNLQRECQKVPTGAKINSSRCFPRLALKDARRQSLPRFRRSERRQARWKNFQIVFAKAAKRLLSGVFDHFDRLLQLRVLEFKQGLLFVGNLALVGGGGIVEIGSVDIVQPTRKDDFFQRLVV